MGTIKMHSRLFPHKWKVMMDTKSIFTLLLSSLAAMLGGFASGSPGNTILNVMALDHSTPPDSTLQQQLESIDAGLRERHGITSDQASAGLLDLSSGRIAMINPDHMEYAASVPKIGILLAYFDLHPEAANDLSPGTRHALGAMIKNSSNEMATRFSRKMGLKEIQEVLNRYEFYDQERGGGLWVGKHYGRGEERYGDPLKNYSHCATVRQLLRFYLLLEQGKLVSPTASGVMREIFASPEIPHDTIKFVKGLAGRDLTILRKWGTWRDWRHDSAIIQGPDRHYILVALTHHPRGDDYLADLAAAVDDLLQNR